MTAEVKVLLEGFTNSDSVAELGEERTQPTITLVRDQGVVMVVDPGILENQQLLIDALAKEDLRPEDVNYVCITHSHIDHYRNIGMFPNAKALEYGGVWGTNTVENWAENFTNNIRILHTPGHDYTCLTLFVKTKDGVVAICGDVFWKENYPRNAHDDAYASNPEKLEESRQMVLKMADMIVPGHGPIYKNDKDNILNVPEPEKTKTKAKEFKITLTCKRCGRDMSQKDKCQCRPYLCFRCCECGLDCNNCSCSHKKRSKRSE